MKRLQFAAFGPTTTSAPLTVALSRPSPVDVAAPESPSVVQAAGKLSVWWVHRPPSIMMTSGIRCTLGVCTMAHFRAINAMLAD